MKILRAAVLGLLLCAGAPGARSLEANGPIAITNVTVIDTTGGPAQAEHDGRDRGRPHRRGRRRRRHDAFRRARASIDGKGKFLIPGLWDMHIHTFFGDWVPGGKEVTLPLFIANGITGVRDMGSDLDPILAARRDVASGALLGPRMVVSGPMLDGPKSQFPAADRDRRRPRTAAAPWTMLKGRGVDFIKIQSYVPREAYFAIADECRKQKHRLRGPRAGCDPRLRGGRRGTEELRAPDRRLRGQLDGRGRPHEGAEGAGRGSSTPTMPRTRPR